MGNAIKKLNLPRDEIVVMIKVYHVVAHDRSNMVLQQNEYDTAGYVNQHGLSRKHIFDSVKASLERLQLDYIDLLQCHRFDYDTPIEETMQALHDVVQASYVRYIGMSSCWAWQSHAMQNYAITHGLTLFISIQPYLPRGRARDVPYVKGVGSIPWSPLARGLITRALSEQTKRGTTGPSLDMHRAAPGTEAITNRVEELSKKKGITTTQVALAWALSKDGVSAPIVGTTSLKNLMELIDGVNIKLTDDEVKCLEEPYKPTSVLGY